MVGDLAADVVLAPDRPLERGTDVAGRVTVSQGGSAANTAGWVARLGASSSLVCSVGTDALGRSLAAWIVTVTGTCSIPFRNTSSYAPRYPTGGAHVKWPSLR